ncbi:MAG: hypothetical protein ACSLFK_10280, partial [Gemmatimonadaceae bacterium]
DIYSLGAVTYEMLTGEAPFTGPTSQAIVAKVITTDPGSLVARRKNIPAHVEDAVLTALEKVPADRFASAAAFGAALTDATIRTSSVARGRAAPEVASRFDWRIVAVTAAAALAIGALAGWMATKSSQTGGQRVAFLHQTDTTHRLQPACCSSAVSISPDGRRIVYSAVVGATPVLMLRNIDDVTSHMLSGSESARNPSFSPDGQWILFEHGRDATGAVTSLRKIPASGGSAVNLVRLDGPLTGATWLEDGTIIYSTNSPAFRGLHRISADGGTPEQLTVPDTTRGEYVHRFASRVPGSDIVLFSILTRSGGVVQSHIATLSPKSGQIKRIAQGTSPQWSQGFLIFGTRDGVYAQRYELGSDKPTGEITLVISGLPLRLATIDFSVGKGGEFVALTGEFEAALHVIKRDGSSKTLQTQIPGLAHFDNPRFAPDGRRIAVSAAATGGHQLYIVDPAAGTSERITFGSNVEHFAWARDGRGVVYLKGGSELAAQATDRSGGERIIWKGNSQALAAITVSDRWIAVTATPVTADGGTSDILILNRDSSVARPYLETPFNESAPAISPDGRWLAYVSDETGREEVYVASFPDASRGRQIISTAGAAEPVWGRAGGLYYRGADGRVVEAAYTFGETFSVTSRKNVGLEDANVSSDATDYDVTAAGDEFVTSHISTVKARLSVILGGLPTR